MAHTSNPFAMLSSHATHEIQQPKPKSQSSAPLRHQTSATTAAAAAQQPAPNSRAGRPHQARDSTIEPHPHRSNEGGRGRGEGGRGRGRGGDRPFQPTPNTNRENNRDNLPVGGVDRAPRSDRNDRPRGRGGRGGGGGGGGGGRSGPHGGFDRRSGAAFRDDDKKVGGEFDATKDAEDSAWTVGGENTIVANAPSKSHKEGDKEGDKEGGKKEAEPETPFLTLADEERRRAAMRAALPQLNERRANEGSGTVALDSGAVLIQNVKASEPKVFDHVAEENIRKQQQKDREEEERKQSKKHHVPAEMLSFSLPEIARERSGRGRDRGEGRGRGGRGGRGSAHGAPAAGGANLRFDRPDPTSFPVLGSK
eukprot:gnl/Spiro4/2253_TR1093_c0_g1_i1.p1 gnl/Spiro4/2253_TR1093_c0_g1~~gnl/Spiro4/2253_TR1093_c0_g1_i1.p1  ORF type:complete len:395 (+),score=84.56 gnl/Spiro4/2253_TR1093_c0_g1_i1:89-1186(+)